MSLVGSLVMVSLALGADRPGTPTKSLQQAALDGDLAQVNLYLSDTRELNSRDAEGRTGLCCAISGEHVAVVTALVTAGADVNVRSQQGAPLYLAAQWGQPDVVRLLLARGAAVNARDDVTGTALHAAAARGHKEAVEVLLEAGADVNAQTQSGVTPLAMAEVMQRQEVAELLRRRQTIERQNGPRPSLDAQRGPYDVMAPRELQMDADPTQGQRGNTPAVLADPNAIRRKVASFAGLAETLTALDEKSRTEQRNWQQRRTDNRTMILRAADTQFAEEMAMVKTTATQENATRTVGAIDALLAKRQARYDAISDELRDERRAALLAEREERRTAGRAATTTRARGRVRGTETTETAAAVEEPVRPARPVEAENGPALDADTQNQVQAWQGAAEDKRPALEVVTTTDLRELDALRQVAASESAARTSAAIEGLMLARQERRAHILERIATDEERQQRLEERTTTRGRGTTQTEAATQGRGRRAR